MFPSLCTLYADLSGVAKKRHIGKKGVYYTQGYTLVLLCGLTEMSAQLRWLENVRMHCVIPCHGLTDEISPPGHREEVWDDATLG